MSLLSIFGLWVGGLLLGMGLGINIGKSIGRKEVKPKNSEIIDDI
jgi:hypothetical protein